jgi:anti-sigma factor RsiW
MTCERIDERLLGMTAGAPLPAFDAEEESHLDACARCRERVLSARAVFAALGDAPREVPPGPAYWASTVPRLRRRIDASAEGGFLRLTPALRNALLPAAAGLVVAIVLATSVLLVPRPGMLETLATLSDSEIHELRLSGARTGLLETTEAGVAVDWTIADFISDLISEQGDTLLYAMADPEEVVARLDDESFAEVVSMLERK